MQSRIYSALFRPMHSRYSLSLSQSRLFLSGVTAVATAAFLFRLWQVHSLVSTIPASVGLRASVWQALTPELAYKGISIVPCVCLSLWSWAAWRRERRQMS